MRFEGEFELIEGIGVPLVEVRHCDADQADRFFRRKERAQEFDAEGAQLLLQSDRRCHRVASRDLLEISVLDFHGDGPPECLRLLAPSPHINGRSREKEAALTGQPAPTAIDSLVKAAARKLRR